MTPQEGSDIERILQRLDEAWNCHDAAAFAALFAPDADFTNVRGMQATGQAGIERFMAPLFATMFARSRQTVLRSTTRVLAAGLAAVDMWWSMEGARTLDGLPRATRFGLASLVMRRDASGWRILVWHNMELAAEPPLDPAAWRFVIFDNRGPVRPAPVPASG